MTKLSERVAKMAESATIKMSQKARDLQAQGVHIINLSIGEPDFDTPNHIKEAAKKALEEGYTKYTPVPGLPELRQAIAVKFRNENSLEYDKESIVVSNGAKQSIANIALALLNEGDEVIIFTPYWVSYIEIVRLCGGVPIELKAGIEDDFKISPDKLQAAITDRTRLLIFSSPCNPTGSVYTKRELEGLAEVLKNHPQIVIVSDEIYEYINFTGSHFSIGAIPSVKDQTVTVNGFSKGFSMTGWRLGYMGAPHWIAKACIKIQSQFTSGASAFGQKAASFALEADKLETKSMRDAFLKRRDIMISGLGNIPGFKVNKPEGAFYIFPDIGSHFGKSYQGHAIQNADDFAEYLLEEAHVATVAGTAFGNDECIRISYAASEAELHTAIDQISRAVSRLN